ncbi:MAG: DUF4391 domain-containing protein [Saccharofermentanales bacterium]|jgi:DNA-binding XRE family transcriptional regulator
MKELPKSTQFNKRIPKEKFYENIQTGTKIKRSFIDQIKAIFWRNKIAPSTTNLAAGNVVSEIEVFEIRLKTNLLDEAVLRQIDREIPYHILFVLEYEGKYQAWIAYKEASAGNMAFKVGQYYHTEWLNKEDLPLQLEGHNMDTAYENFVYQIAGETLQRQENKSLQDAVEQDERIKNLNKQIETLRTKIRNEKQLNVQMKLNSKLKKLKRKLEELSNG